MNIDSIQNGVVLDHIQAGKSMDIYKYLHLDQLDCSVAIIKNVRSGRMGKKDIIKIDSPLEVDVDVLGYIDDKITVNIIRDGARTEKRRSRSPRRTPCSSSATRRSTSTAVPTATPPRARKASDHGAL